ncbi:Dabb family protein [Prauserella endophytica]|uniref:Dabb family protein n=1 Tax=Prauserella endophytica TaxID=1592324 RepID=A0ABY2RSE9_9PSEU|nr:Dabb family protein [Prauserella endophytica]TKG58381.1 Dabb family protein [Prauserella endophytica]
MLTHTVLLRLHRPVDSAARQQLISGLQAFGTEAPFAVGPVSVGTDLQLRDAANPRVADVAMVMTFDTAEDFAAYLDHPRHRGLVIDLLQPLCESWLSVQNEVPT